MLATAWVLRLAAASRYLRLPAQEREPHLASAEDAADFVKEHKGARVLRFDEVGAELPAMLDAGRFE